MADENKKHKKTERVMVHCRVRPLNDEDLRNYGKETIIDTVDQNRGTVSLKREFDRKCFTFDSVFDGTSSQKEIFSKVAEPVVNSVLQGYNGTIFAYGQTGTGKTFTMIGSSGENKGVIPRSISQIFLHIQQSPSHSFSVKIGFLQLYMEMLQDLLSPDENKTIKIRENNDDGVYLTGVSWKSVNNVKQCMDWLSVGDRNRSTAFTSMNAHSSRSHAVYMVKIEKRVKYTPEQLEELEKKGDTPDQSMTKSTLYLVDLAGSERVSKSKATGSRLDEAKNINLALLALGNCIQALSDKKAKYVPFRDSKLTRLLEDSLGGNSKTSLIVTIGPSSAHVQESLSAMQFGQRAMKIENRPEKNIKVDYRALCSQLQAEVDKFNDGNNMFSIEKDQLLEEINSLKSQVEKLTIEKEQMEAELEEFRKGHNDLGKFEEVKKAEMQKIHSQFKAKLDKKDAEHKKLLEQIDEVVANREEELKREKNNAVELRNKVNYLNNENKALKEELEQEKSDRQVRGAQLISENEELKQKLLAEKNRNLELNEERKDFQQFKKEKEDFIAELNEKYKNLVLKHSQETEALNKELQKFQAISEKMKNQFLLKTSEFKENQEKSEKNWQEIVKNKEKNWNEKLKELETKLNEQSLKLNQAERENLSLKEDLKHEKDNFSQISLKLEKIKENYEEKIQNLEKDLQEQKLKENQQIDEISNLKQQLELEKQSRKEESSNFSHDLKASKHKNAKLLKLYKELESKIHLKSEEIEKIQSEKAEIFQSLQKISAEKEELVKEQEDLNSQIVNLNKDRSKLIAKTESLSKKTSSFAKMKDKLSNEAEVKQQEFKMLSEQREYLEEEVENLKSLVEKKDKDLKGKEIALDEMKNSNSAFVLELQKKDSLLDGLGKKNLELENRVCGLVEKVESFKEKYRNVQGEYEKIKGQLENFVEKVKDLEIKNGGLMNDLKQSKDISEKTIKDLAKVKEELIKSTNEYEDQLSSISHQKDQLQSKHLKLLEDFKTNESANFTLKNSLKQKSSDLQSLKEKCLEFEQFFKSRTKLCNESLAMLDAKSSLLSTSGDTIKFFIIKLKETIRAKDLQIEKIQNLSKKESLIQAENFSKEINSIKQSNRETVEALEEKYSQEIQELQSYYEDIIKKGNLKSEKSQEDLKIFYMNQISSINSTHSRQIEDLKSTQMKVIQEIKNSLETQLEEQKEDLLTQIDNLKSQLKKSNEKYQEDMQKLADDWQTKLDQMRLADDETLNAMLKAKQKEMDMILNENKSLKMDFESTLDRQKTQSSNMKNHQLGLLEEVNRSHLQEIEALNMENSNKIKRKDAEINDLKKKLKETIEGNNENFKEIVELKENYEKMKVDNKKLENDYKKIDVAKKNLEENLKILNKKVEIEKGKTSDLESQNFDLNEKLSLLTDEKNKLFMEVKKLTQQNKKFEEEMNQNLKSNNQMLDSEIKTLKSQLLKLETEKEVTLVLQNLLNQLEKKDTQEKNLKTKSLELENTKKFQTLNETSQKLLKSSKEDYSSYISHLVLDKILLVLEANDLQKQISDLKSQKTLIKSHLSGDFSLTNYIKTSVKDSKRGANLFEFLNSFTSCYQKLQEKVTNQSTSFQIFSLSKVANEKFMNVCRSLASKSETSKKLYEKPSTELEKELGITGQSKSMSHQEILAKRVKDTEKNITLAVSSLMDQLVLVIELQQLSASEIRYQLESRKRKIEPLMKIDELKMLEVQIFTPPKVKDLEEVEQITALKRLAENLTGNLTVISALYSYLFSRCVYLEYLVDDRSELVALMLPNMQIQRTFKVHNFKKPFKFNKDQIDSANEFLGKAKDQKVKVCVKEEDLEEEKKKINKLMHSRAGLQLMKRHFNEIDASFTSICKKFMSTK